MKTLMTGNEAIARGAYEAGVRLVSSYPGTPSTEITENTAKYEVMHSEWAPNEKVAMETAVGAAIGGARALACMKHVGVNVAMDPLMTVTYSGVRGGLVFVSADDPGMHSSQNEQDNRQLGKFAKLPVLEPSDSAEALAFTKRAFELSERFDTPVMLHTTMRVAHSQSVVETGEREERPLPPYAKDAAKYVMVPANARSRHTAKEKQLAAMAEFAETTELNRVELRDTAIGVICGGAVYQYVREALPEASVLKLGVINPLPAEKLRSFAAAVKKLYVIEELDDVIESECRRLGLAVQGRGLFSPEGEIFPQTIRQAILGIAPEPAYSCDSMAVPRPPVLCAGCPHRATFYVLSQLKLHVFGDIGCYTLAAGAPLCAMDTTICMGASVGMAHGLEKTRGREFSRETVAVLGDSTFVHSGITPLIHAVYNQSAITVMILDNRITAMTGHQDNPLTGRDAMGRPAPALDLEALVRGCGVKRVVTVDPFDVKALRRAVKEETQAEEVSVIIVRRTCELLVREKRAPFRVEPDLCRECGSCLAMGCPAMEKKDKMPLIHAESCVGCGLCANICAHHAIVREGE